MAYREAGFSKISKQKTIWIMNTKIVRIALLTQTWPERFNEKSKYCPSISIFVYGSCRNRKVDPRVIHKGLAAKSCLNHIDSFKQKSKCWPTTGYKYVWPSLMFALSFLSAEAHCKYFDCTQYSFWQFYISHCNLALHVIAQNSNWSQTVLLNVTECHRYSCWL